jgi:putative membrane protein
MDEQLENQIDEILSSIQGDETEVQSFVSEKNQNIDNVQFVIKTKAIEQEKTEKVVSKEPEDTSLWKKFIQLFGF